MGLAGSLRSLREFARRGLIFAPFLPVSVARSESRPVSLRLVAEASDTLFWLFDSGFGLWGGMAKLRPRFDGGLLAGTMNCLLL